MDAGYEPFVYLFNVDDIDSYVFADDNRFNDNGKIDTIVTSEPFFRIDAADATFSEEINDENNKYEQLLTINLKYSEDLEILLHNARNSRYLACFKKMGRENFNSIGYKYGASLGFSVQDGGNYTLTFSDTSEYPSLIVDASNFDLENKYFTPIFSPKYDIFTCEQTEGKNNGYKTASFVVKTNSAGQALDINNQLCSVTGKKQVAYKFEDIQTDQNYYVIDTYDSTASFDGKPVKIYSYEDCPIDAQGTITVNKETIYLNSTTTTSNIAITTIYKWQVIELPSILNISQQSGDGDATITVISTNVGGDVVLKIQNVATYEIVEIAVHINIIRIERSSYTFSNSTRQTLIPVYCEGGLATYEVAVNQPYLTVIQETDRVNLLFSKAGDGVARTWTMTFTHNSDPNEVKRIAINVLGSDANPTWTLMTQYCENITSLNP